jgi:iron complex transport system substrate-binding protein
MRGIVFSLILSPDRSQDLRCEFCQRQMKKLIILFLLFTFHFLLHTSAYASEPPNRIVSLAPNLTEILFAMGLGDRIVGVTNFCDYPEEAKKKTKVGGIYNPSLEAVVSLKPDIVVMTTDGNLREFEERLHSLKIRTYVFRARRLNELPQGIRDLGLALGVKERAEILANEIETAINRFRFERGRQGGIRALFIIWPEPLIVAGSGTSIDDAITLLGYQNVASKANSSYPKYSVEEIIHQAPDIIFIGKGHVNVKEASKGLLEKLSKIPAVKNGKVCYISDSIYRLGPRIVKGIKEMARCLK